MLDNISDFEWVAEEILADDQTDTTKLARMVAMCGKLYQVAIAREHELNRMVGGDGHNMVVSIMITPQELKDRAVVTINKQIEERK